MDYSCVDELLHYCNVSFNELESVPAVKIQYYDFTFVLDGIMHYVVDGKPVLLHKNDAMFLKSGAVRTRLKTTEHVKYVSFNFTAKPGWEFPFDVYMKNIITSDIRKLLSVYPLSHLSENFHAKEKCISILNYVLLELLDMHSLNISNSYILKIYKYIDEHIEEKLTLKKIAQHVHLSEEYTSRIFKRETNIHLTNYINKQKCLYAKRMITTGTHSLQDISAKLGFENYGYFSKSFKKHIGTVPSKIKKNSMID